MRFLLTFLHVLSTGFLLSLLGPSSSYMLANAMPVERSLTIVPKRGSFVCVTCGAIQDAGFRGRVGLSPVFTSLSSTVRKCAILLTGPKSFSGMLTGIVFSEKDPAHGKIQDNKIILEDPKFAPIVKEIESNIGNGFNIYKGYGTVSEKNAWNKIGDITIGKNLEDRVGPLFVDKFEKQVPKKT